MPTGMWRRRLASFGLLGLLGWAAPTHARDGEAMEIEALIKVARNAVIRELTVPPGGRLSLTFTPPDSRLRLARCATAPRAELARTPAAGGPVSVRLTCEDPTPWRLYLQGQAEIRAPVLIARTDLPRGILLKASHFEPEEHALHTLPGGYAVAAESLEGRRLRQALRQGTPISPRATEAPLWVRTGEPVTLAAGGDGLTVRMEGVALSSGSDNATVRVRNLRSNKILQGRVIAPGLIQVGY
jgi:flagella basal body P-ring formation protein FlgA